MVGRLKKEYPELEAYALAHNIPIMQKEGIMFLVELCQKQKYHSCLEIGSAIGYSALMLVKNIDDFYVETIEIDENRYEEAIMNRKKHHVENVIMIHHDDALTFPISELSQTTFDCLFIDAAKAQYQKFFEKYMPLISKDGVCVVDNLDFHGMVDNMEMIKNRNTKQLVRKIKRFRDWLFDQEEYDVTYYAIGDGICVVRRK